ncbi:hypothetical protein POTOM_045948 [Populus tomentosa]|uniref:DUF7731 domain-containing protein n=1 Tax=Populus tomentosa TaxID=118781 RepID=A0A8X7YLU3_POPTO|nr:hypothetical protein POTOM_045948 [Populus tomentosa]
MEDATEPGAGTRSGVSRKNLAIRLLVPTLKVFDEYNAPLTRFPSNLPDYEKVGHGAGGLSLTDAIHRFAKKIRMAIYVAASMLKHGSDQDIKDESARCSANYKIELSGAVVVSQSEVVEYCKPGGCVEHVYYVLKCIHYVKRDFWFANKATVLDLNRTISQACATKSGLDSTIFTSSGMKTLQRVTCPRSHLYLHWLSLPSSTCDTLFFLVV